MGPIVMTLLVRDELDLVRTWLDYHLGRGIDLVLATDHLSVDGTSDVLREYVRAGVLRLFREDGEGFAQSKWVTRMARLAAVEHQAAWLLHADADEFWWPTEGDLRSTLGALSPEIGLLSVARSNFLPGGDEEEPFFARMIVRDRSSVNALGQSLPPKVCHRGSADVIVAEGNHAAFSERLGPAMPTTKLEVLHYPARTYAQLERKVLHGARALDENRTLAADTGITWRWLRTELAEGRLQDYWAAQQRLGMRPDGDRYVRDERLKDYLLALQCQRNAG